jgi:hypothetical protein
MNIETIKIVAEEAGFELLVNDVYFDQAAQNHVMDYIEGNVD